MMPVCVPPLNCGAVFGSAKVHSSRASPYAAYCIKLQHHVRHSGDDGILHD